MPTIGSNSKPAYVYDAGTDTWIPIGPGEHTHDYATSAHNHDSTYIAKTLTTTTGDILYASSANTPARLGIGSSGQVLTVASGIPAWAAPSTVGNFTHINASGSTTSFPNSVDTKVIWTTENYDTLNEFASSRFTATTAGYYLVNAGVGTDPQALGPNTVFETSIYKNGSKTFKGAVYSAFNVTGRLSARCSAVVSLAVNDYIEIYFNQNATATTTGQADGPQTFLTIDRIVS